MNEELRKRMLKEFGCNKEQTSQANIKSNEVIGDNDAPPDDPIVVEEEYQYDDAPCQECDDDVSDEELIGWDKESGMGNKSVLHYTEDGEDCCNEDSRPPGFIVIHQHIGSLAPHKAEAFCERVKDHFTKSKEWLDFKAKNPNWSFVLLPSRTEESFVEVFHEDAGVRKNVISEIAKIVLEKEPPIQDSPELRRRIKDYILLMLGAPVVKLEFTEDQLNFCYEHTLNLIHDYHTRVKRFSMTESYRAQSEDFLQRGAYAHAMVILGRIRMQQNVPQDGRTHLPAEDLYNEGKETLAEWKAWLVPGEEEKEETGEGT